MAKDTGYALTGYALSRQWFDWTFENPEQATANNTALYMWFIEKWNRSGQPAKLSVSTSESMAAIGIKDRHTYSNAFKKLVEFGFVEIVSESKNQHQCNVIAIGRPPSEKRQLRELSSLDKAILLGEKSPGHTHGTPPGTAPGNSTINKPLNNKTIKEGFAPPTVEMCMVYLRDERRVPAVNAQRLAEDFTDHFISNGWRVGGKAPMKDWQAALRRWERNDEKFHRKPTNGVVVPIKKHVPTREDFSNDEQWQMHLKVEEDKRLRELKRQQTA